jgi:hypothetical protein
LAAGNSVPEITAMSVCCRCILLRQGHNREIFDALTATLACVLRLTLVSGTNDGVPPIPKTWSRWKTARTMPSRWDKSSVRWTKPWEMAGTPGKQDTGTFSGEITGNTSRFDA